MRFTLIDRILELKPGDEITAIKSLSLSEDYLADHFPLFPVLPGVFMLEAMTQASAWLIRYSEDFANSVVILKEARNVKYSNFVEPGSTLTLTAKWLKNDERTVTFKTQGEVDGELHVSARLVLERYNLADTNPDEEPNDQSAIDDLKSLFSQLYRPRAIPAPVGDARG
ncbi:MAG: 3-hydroxyacyl-ACP dehydratase FabZ family protein [Pirellulales bacterium]|nr:3-hydroxyacyl-ACP dehydratase FabZ family protein [Pirellulales bacterium]